MFQSGGESDMKKAVGCPVETTLRVIGGRWKVLVIHHLLEGPRRFGELGGALAGVSARTLAKQLRELEADGVVDRAVLRAVPPMVEYSLTAEGRKLTPILLAMHEWGEAYEREEASRRRAIRPEYAAPVRLDQRRRGPETPKTPEGVAAPGSSV